MGFKEAIKKKIKSEVEPILKTINFFKRLFNKLIDLTFGSILKIAPKPISNWVLTRPKKHRWAMGIITFLIIFGSPDHFSTNGFSCNSLWTFIVSPFALIGYMYAFLYANKKYPKWAWPEQQREEMQNYYRQREENFLVTWDWAVTPWQVDGLGRPIVYPCYVLFWKRIWHSLWIALPILLVGCVPFLIVFYPLFALIDKIIPAAQCLV